MNILLSILMFLLGLFVFLGAITMVVLIWRTVNAVMNDNKEWQNNYKPCVWVDSESECSVYESECGNTFCNFNEGEPVTDWATYCPYCGGKIIVKTGDK